MPWSKFTIIRLLQNASSTKDFQAFDRYFELNYIQAPEYLDESKSSSEFSSVFDKQPKFEANFALRSSL